MARAVPMRKVWEARRLISLGYSVKDVSEKLNMSESSVYSYTKQERARAN